MYKDFLEDAKEAFNGELVEALNEAAVVTDAPDVIYNTKISENEPKSKPKTAAAYKFDLLGDDTPPEFTLFFEGVPIASAGNIIGLTGPEKGGKSTVCSIIAAAAANTEIAVCGYSSQGLQSIIWIDTEQTNYYARLQFRRAAGLSCLDLRTFAVKGDFYTLRGASISERYDVLFEVLEDAPNYSLVIVDGITDVLENGINDEKGAVELAGALMEIAERKKLTIVTVIHTNKSDAARGWVGGELGRKCETVIKVKSDSDKNILDVTFPLTRGKKPAALCTLSIDDENGFPYRVNDVPKDPGRPAKYDVEFWRKLYGDDTQLHAKELEDRLIKAGVESKRTRGVISESKTKGILKQPLKIKNEPYIFAENGAKI